MHIYTQEFHDQERPCQIGYRLRLEVRGKRLEIALEVAILESAWREVKDRSHGRWKWIERPDRTE